jgi:thioesterase domain-containing protein/predicted RNA methylase/acyl carrier protein
VVHDSQDERLNAYVVQKNRVELWPSIAEFYVYDDIVYHSMATHESRNQQYLAAFQRVLADKTVVEVGPGPEVILSRLALQAGARKIYAIELLEDTYRKAQDTVMRMDLSDKIILIHGDATQVQLPEPVDYCISEIVGSIGGAEGAAIIINSVRRFLSDGCNMIPQRSVTKIAAISLPESQFDYCFSDIAAHYTQKIFEQVGYSFDLRLCVKNLPLTQLISSSDVFEYLDYTQPINLENSHEICLEFNQNRLFTGLLVWLTLHADPDHIIDILKEQHSWLPVYLPVSTEGIPVKTGDRFVATITRQLCDNRFNPDYLLEGALYRQGHPALPIRYHSYHFNPHYRDHPFYQKLFANDKVPALPKLDAGMLRNHLSQYLPDYMIPSHFTVLDQMPLTPNGKIDRKALPAPNAQKVNKHYQVPRDTVELQLAQIWENVLEVRPIGIFENFFELGGHSLLAVKLMSHIQQTFNLHLSIAILFQRSTIAELAEVIHNHDATWATMIPIQPLGNRTPLFCLPGAVGFVIYLHSLATHLGKDQPFYGLESPGLDGKSTRPDTIEVLAANHLNELKKVQPQGPYYLAGHSFGAIVAFELAYQLEQHGETVAFLVIFDSPVPYKKDDTSISLVNEIDFLWLFVGIFEELTGTQYGLTKETLQSQATLEQSYELVMQHFRQQGLFFAPTAESDQLKGMVDTYKANMHAIIRYQAQGSITAPIVLFRAQELPKNKILDPKKWDWSQYTSEKVTVVWTPGSHITMVKEPLVKQLAAKLQAYLES